MGDEKGRLVRARVKAVEYLPGWAKCCERGTSARAQLGEHVFDMSAKVRYGPGEIGCAYCDFTVGHEVIAYYSTTSHNPELVDFYDLDEGPIP